MIADIIKQQIVYDLRNSMLVSKVKNKYNVSRYTIRKIRQEFSQTFSIYGRCRGP